MLPEQLLQEVITCPKRVVKADRKKMILENRHYKNKLDLLSTDDRYAFKMFMRQSDEFIEDFSVGLIWTNPQEHINVNKSIVMLRCQGPHDGKQAVGFDLHHDFHTHEISLSDIQDKRFLKPSNRTINNNFRSFEQALMFFVEKCAIINIEDFIELSFDPNQITFDESGD